MASRLAQITEAIRFFHGRAGVPKTLDDGHDSHLLFLILKTPAPRPAPIPPVFSLLNGMYVCVGVFRTCLCPSTH